MNIDQFQELRQKLHKPEPVIEFLRFTGDPNNKTPSRRFRPAGRKRLDISVVPKILLIRLGILLDLP
ncbi:hypothetical protein [Nostoc sp. CALU 1950]|uniref:hypothetical protein n=1 Tax=Nostoc sp. CALU 1950 TaxID=3104321 RepID=UPI003EC0C454